MLSWALDFFLRSVPSEIWLVGAIVGLVLFFFTGILSHFSSIKIYAKFFKPIAGILTLTCVFMYGGSGVQAMWEEKVRLAQEEIDKKTAMAQQLKEDLEREMKKKAQVRVEYRDRIRTEIKEVEKIIDAKCEIEPQAIQLLNKAASNPEKAK